MRKRSTPTLLACALCAFIRPSPALAQPGAEDPAPGEPHREYIDDTRLRSHLHEFASIISFDSPLTIGRDVVGVLERIEAIRTQDRDGFASDPSLLRASREVFSYLARSVPAARASAAAAPRVEDLLIPALAEELPEVALMLTFIRAFEVASAEQVLANWQSDYDTECAKAYRMIFPSLRSVSPGVDTDEPIIEVVGRFSGEQWVYLEAVNRSGYPLTNVSLAIQLGTIDGASADHYYFVPHLGAGHRYPLRLSMQWNATGAKATTWARINLVSDEFIASNIHCRIDDHIPIAADMFLDSIAVQLQRKSKPKIAIDRLNAMRSSLGMHPLHMDRCVELLRQGNNMLRAEVDRLDAQLKKDRASLREAEIQRRKRGNRESTNTLLDRQIRALRASIERLERERMAWLKGER